MAKLNSGTRIYGNVTIDTFVTASGNVIAGNVTTVGLISSTGNVTSGNVLTGGIVSATGNITGGNISATAHTGTNVSVTGTVTAASVVGGVITGSSTSVTGTTTAQTVIANTVTANTVSGRASLGTDGGGSISLGFQANNASATTPYIDFNTSSAYTDFDVRVQASGNTGVTGAGTLTVTAATLAASAALSAVGNIQGGNLRTAGLVSATGNVLSGGNLIVGTAPYSNTGVGTGPTIISSSYLLTTTNGADLMYTRRQASGVFQTQTFTGSNAGTLALQPYGGQLTIGLGANTSAYMLDVAGTANISGNITTAGLISATGNITGNYFIGNGSQLTGVVGENVVLNDISNQFDNVTSVFALKQEQSAVTNIVDSRNLQVIVGGQPLSPYVTLANWPFVGPFFTPYDSYRGFRVKSNSVGSNVIIYNSPAIGDQATVTIINNSTTVQTRRYPYSPETIALGD